MSASPRKRLPFDLSTGPDPGRGFLFFCTAHFPAMRPRWPPGTSQRGPLFSKGDAARKHERCPKNLFFWRYFPRSFWARAFPAPSSLISLACASPPLGTIVCSHFPEVVSRQANRCRSFPRTISVGRPRGYVQAGLHNAFRIRRPEPIRRQLFRLASRCTMIEQPPGA